MKQYYGIKAKYPDALLLFRVGDFYETFGEDAIRAANVLGIVLTKRANGAASFVELAGFPHHSLDSYLPRLVRAGMRVAICDQLEDPKLAKKIVKRGVTELVTPGVSYNDKILEHKKNNFLAAIYPGPKSTGLAFIDISTGEFLVAEGSQQYADKLLQGFNPGEIVYPKSWKKQFTEHYGNAYYSYVLDEWVFQEDNCRESLIRHFGTKSLKGFGVEDWSAAIVAAGAALHYVSDTRQDQLKHIASIARIEEDKYVWLDKFSIRNLELVSSANEKAVTLLDVIDHTCSPMGARKLKRWLMLPLRDVKSIEERQQVVQYFLDNPEFSQSASSLIKQTGDLERVISKVALGKISPREVYQLKRALDIVSDLKKACASAGNETLERIADRLNPCILINEKISAELKEDAPAMLNKGGVIREGVNAELDELRSVAFHGKDHLLKIQQRESEITGIPSLKVGFNNVFGYYIEVTHTHKDKVPSSWTRKQTLSNAERYITEELKNYEEKILGAEEKILQLESRLFTELVQSLLDYIQPVQLNASLIARLDCLLSFSICAIKNSYVRPEVNDSKIIDIKNGRHPVIEKQLPPGEKFVANDIYLDPGSQQILMITGPNMSGKSALLRQTALITLLAQIGSYVPASHASIGIVDKIFTRVGASDNISSGESTFMVEMNETASILHNISDRSLILLDEIGRGTATYDGISIAWAIAEYLHENGIHRPKTLFATHYHELNEMAESMPRIRNFHVSVKELEHSVLFLRKLEAGGSEHSFGIHVARMAGVPVKVVQRAGEILKDLESSRGGKNLSTKRTVGAKDNLQLSFIQLDDPVLEQIREELIKTDINNLTPVEALNKLNEIRKLLGR
ncbi:MAG: DNA mismatch repair protein MutS [Bacteroidetes bacterium]|nr:MAG: DNA mismatch repair protein MutS [Bacteroidota bacterium]REK05360.1 MAG: DNA mismatch repair protein MutS [Bacteroidota bacterium]REK32734.1 MAG: DNA mismatch repair protein MutS [Bacteroidota bacterium]REK49071.1 MAG: DNA mismatch repair protein MutS [Bacteroidota bacterium]